jgi:acyl carrier protein
MKIEEEFSIAIHDEEAERMLTVGDLVAYVERAR